MRGAVKYALLAAAVMLLPSLGFAQVQGTLTGTVRDASGGVLPGVTVEASSPAIQGAARTVVTDGAGIYRIIDLPSGTYSLAFTLPGFSQVIREGIQLSGGTTLTIPVELRVGDLQETITVTGETPVVDVQSVRQQTTVSKDILAAIPTSRNATGITSLIPGMSNNSDAGGVNGTIGGGVGVSIDDFGTGRASLELVQRLPLTEVKIDRSLVQSPARAIDDAVRACIEIVRERDAIVVAEGVETPGHYERAMHWGCDRAQGYYFSRPLPIEDLEPLLLGAA